MGGIKSEILCWHEFLDEQKDRQKGLFFSLVCIELE